MSLWLLVAAVGAVLAVAGWMGLGARYRRGEIGAAYLVWAGVGFASFCAYAVAANLLVDGLSGAMTLVLLLPALVAIVMIVREHERGQVHRG